MAFFKKTLGQVDLETGEVQEGLVVLVADKKRLKDRFMMMTGQGLTMLARDKDLKGEDWKVLLVYLGTTDFENIVTICQKDITEILGMKKGNVSRATKKLVSKNILLEVAKSGRSNVYRLNTVYGWKEKLPRLTMTYMKAIQSLLHKYD